MNKIREQGDEVLYICAFCPASSPDETGHLYVNYIKGLFNCVRCGTSGTVADLKKKLNLTFIDSPSLEILKKKLKRFEVKEFKELKLPEDYELVPEGTEAYNYLSGRGINKKTIEDYSLGYTSVDNFNTIWFPDFDDSGNLVFYQRRKYRKTHLKDDNILRWRNPNSSIYRVYKTSQVYNYYKARKFKELNVVEGPTSSIAVGLNCCGTYSMNWSNIQAKMIATSDAEKIYVVFDGEDMAFNKARKLCKVLSISGKLTYAVRLPDGEDPDSITKKTLDACKKKAEPFEPSVKNFIKNFKNFV